jgi:hypothetical protein
MMRDDLRQLLELIDQKIAQSMRFSAVHMQLERMRAYLPLAFFLCTR